MSETNSTSEQEELTDENERGELTERLSTLESVNEDLRARVEELEQQTQEPDNAIANSGSGTVSRRGTLATLTGLGLLGIGATGSASAASSHLGEQWSGSPSNPGLDLRIHNGGHALNAVVTPTSGFSNPIRAKTDSDEGVGIMTEAVSGTGETFGIWSEVESPQGRAIRGFNRATSGLAIAINGRTFSTGGIGLQGSAVASSGNTIGLQGDVNSPDGTALKGQANSTNAGSSRAVYGVNDGADATSVEGYASGTGSTYGVMGRVDSSNGYGLYTPDDAKIDGELFVDGSKHFVQSVDTPAGTKQVTYTSVEAGRALTEYTDVAQLEDGRAEVELPEHFGLVTSDEEPLRVQVTPYASEAASPQVVERSTDEVVIEDFSDETREYTFAITVKGVREGYEDQETVRDV